MKYKEGSKQKGGQAYRQHQTLKKYIRERDNYTCQFCGQPGNIVDHIEPWQVSHDSSVANLRVLCHACNLATRRQRCDANPLTTLEAWYKYLENELAL